MNQEEIKKEIREAFRETGRQGGLATSKKYGKAHYQKLAKRMNEVKRKKNATAKHLLSTVNEVENLNIQAPKDLSKKHNEYAWDK